MQDPSLSDEEYNLTVAENANQSRIEDILEGIGFERSGGSNISMSSYYRKEVGIGEYDPEHDEHEDYEVYEIRVSDHEDRHPPSDDVKDRINVGFRGGVSGWSDLDLGPDVISVKIKNEILGALPSEAIRDIDMPDEAERVRALKSIEVTTTDIIEETGESVEITETAFDAMDRIDTRLRDLESMLDCLK